jgi:hypothetical protein
MLGGFSTEEVSEKQCTNEREDHVSGWVPKCEDNMRVSSRVGNELQATFTEYEVDSCAIRSQAKVSENILAKACWLDSGSPS